MRADSVEQPNPTFPNGSSYFESTLPPGIKPTGCDKVPFQPTTAVDPGTPQTDSPSGPLVEVKVPFEESGTAIANSNVKDAVVTLPRGMGLNPAAAPGLQACTDDQFGKGTRNPVACPAGSKIGTVSIADAAAARRLAAAATSTSASSSAATRTRATSTGSSSTPSRARYGVSVRLIGNVNADPLTGQLTHRLQGQPRRSRSARSSSTSTAAKGVLTSPPTCGPERRPPTR